MGLPVTTDSPGKQRRWWRRWLSGTYGCMMKTKKGKKTSRRKLIQALGSFCRAEDEVGDACVTPRGRRRRRGRRSRRSRARAWRWRRLWRAVAYLAAARRGGGRNGKRRDSRAPGHDLLEVGRLSRPSNQVGCQHGAPRCAPYRGRGRPCAGGLVGCATRLLLGH